LIIISFEAYKFEEIIFLFIKLRCLYSSGQMYNIYIILIILKMKNCFVNLILNRREAEKIDRFLNTAKHLYLYTLLNIIKLIQVNLNYLGNV
jgi:hypothetical protein